MKDLNDLISIALLGGFVFLIYFLFNIIRARFHINFISNKMMKGNTLVFGSKGAGKDMLFNMLTHYQNEAHYSNIKYNEKTEIISIKELGIEPNTFENALENKWIKIKPRFKEKQDFFISDGGIYLPSQYDHQLDKAYPSLFLFYVLIRHLYNSNIHINYNGSLGRLYKKLREQADHFILVKETKSWLKYWVRVKAIYYDKYETAEAKKGELDSRILNGFSQAEADKWKAENGEIKELTLIMLKKNIKYNSRHFKDIILNTNKEA